jgi:hypothetical protein
MTIVIALGIAMAVGAFVAAPFFFGVGQTTRAGTDDGQVSLEIQDLLLEKESVYAAIQELDFDWKSGKLSAEDHQAARQRQEESAAAVLQQIDALQGIVEKPAAPHRAHRKKRRG